MSPEVLYFAPGSGLGHATRALAICLELRDLGIEAGIVTNSPYAGALAGLSRMHVTRIATADWSTGAPRLLTERAPKLSVIDTFPNGMRGEWNTRPRTPMVHVARRLRLDEYRAVATAWEGFVLTIAIEQLASEHDALLREPVVRLPGLIRLRPMALATPVPPDLDRLLDGGAALVIHSGPSEEVEQLVELADHEERIAVIAPAQLQGTPAFDYFPAANLIERARRIYTGAGYNSIADTMHCRQRHTAIPFPRRYDDQAARLASLQTVTTDSTRAAAEAIAAVLGG